MLTRELGLLFCCLWVYDGLCVFFLRTYQGLLDYLESTPDLYIDLLHFKTN